jgi:hypothetical protein
MPCAQRRLAPIRGDFARVSAALLAVLTMSACNGDDVTAPQRVTLSVGNGAGGTADLTWVAAQDGDGAWTQLSPTAPGSYGFEVKNGSGRYAVAFVCKVTGVGEVLQATVAGATRLEVICAARGPGGFANAWRGALKGLAAGATPTVTLGSGGLVYPAALADDASSYLVMLPNGTFDLAAADAASGNARVVVSRNIAVNGSGNTDVDFGTGAMMAQEREVKTVNLEPTEDVTAFSTFSTAAGATLGFSSGTRVSVLDDKQLAAGDRQRLIVSSFSPSGSERGVTQPLSSSDPAPLTPALPPRFVPEVKAIAASTIVRPRATLPQRLANTTFFQMEIAPGAPPPTAALTWILNVEAAWVGNGTSFELPDLTTLPGYDATFGPDPKLPALVSTTAVDSTAGFEATINGKDADLARATIRHAKGLTTLPPMR